MQAEPAAGRSSMDPATAVKAEKKKRGWNTRNRNRGQEAPDGKATAMGARRVHRVEGIAMRR